MTRHAPKVRRGRVWVDGVGMLLDYDEALRVLDASLPESPEGERVFGEACERLDPFLTDGADLRDRILARAERLGTAARLFTPRTPFDTRRALTA
jgi:hypothetical protein